MTAAIAPELKKPGLRAPALRMPELVKADASPLMDEGGRPLADEEGRIIYAG